MTLAGDVQDMREKATTADEDERYRGRRAGTEGWALPVYVPKPRRGFTSDGFGTS